MDVVYVVLLALGAVCLLAAAGNVAARVNMLALGLLLWIMVPLLQYLTALTR